MGSKREFVPENLSKKFVMKARKIEFHYLQSSQNMIVCNMRTLFFDILGNGRVGPRMENDRGNLRQLAPTCAEKSGAWKMKRESNPPVGRALEKGGTR